MFTWTKQTTNWVLVAKTDNQWRFHCGLILTDILYLTFFFWPQEKQRSNLRFFFKLSFIKSRLHTNKITGLRLIMERNRGKCNSDCWILKNKPKNKFKRWERDNVRGGKVHLTCLLWEPYAAKLDFIFQWINCGGLRKVESGWLGWGGEGERVEEGGIRFPFGCSHRHFHHCRQCRGKSPLHGAPGTQGKMNISVVNSVRERHLFLKWGIKAGKRKYLIQLAHGGRGGWNDVVYKEEERILGSQVDSFPDEEVKLAHCQKNTEHYNSCWMTAHWGDLRTTIRLLVFAAITCQVGGD